VKLIQPSGLYIQFADIHTKQISRTCVGGVGAVGAVGCRVGDTDGTGVGMDVDG
jgi:hypothetical protein